MSKGKMDLEQFAQDFDALLSKYGMGMGVVVVPVEGDSYASYAYTVNVCPDAAADILRDVAHALTTQPPFKRMQVN